MEHTKALYPLFDEWRKRGRTVAITGAALALFGLMFAADKRLAFLQAYLWAYLLILALPMGALAALMLHQIVAGAWGYMIQRVLEAMSRTLPYLAVGFLPILLGMRTLYAAWVEPQGEMAAQIVGNKSWWLDVDRWQIRALAYFAIWMALVVIFNWGTQKLDKTGNLKVIKWLRFVAPVGLLAYVLTMTFAAVDWAMSLEPTWFSTIYGPHFFVSQGLTTIAFSIVMLSVLYKYRPISDVFNIEFFHHLGNLLLAFVVLWAYISFSQFLIIWSGNIPEEIPWYLARSGAGMNTVAVALMLFHFFVPMLTLFFKRSKRSITNLRNLAVAILFMRLVDTSWVLMPAFHPNKIGIGPLQVGLLLLLAGLWLYLFVGELKKRPLLVQNDPRLLQAIHHNVHHDEEEAYDHA